MCKFFALEYCAGNASFRIIGNIQASTKIDGMSCQRRICPRLRSIGKVRSSTYLDDPVIYRGHPGALIVSVGRLPVLNIARFSFCCASAGTQKSSRATSGRNCSL